MNGPSASSILQALFHWALQTSLAATVLIVLVTLAQRALRKWLPAKWTYALWLCVLLRLVMPAAPPAGFSIFNFGQTTSLVINDATSPVVAPSEPAAVPGAFISPEAQPDVLEQSDIALTTASASKPHLFIDFAPYAWIAGTLAYVLLSVVHHRHFYRWLKRQRPLDDARLTNLMIEAKRSLNIRTNIPIIEVAGPPSLFGAFKPHLLLPRSALEKMSEAELRHIILHELIHLKRHDVFLNWLVIFVQSLHWFNPFVWFAMRRLRAARELACDAAVLRRLPVEERKSYGTTLIKIIDSWSKISSTPGLVPIVNRKKQMHRRISMIANYKPTTRLVAAASALLIIVLGCVTFTRGKEKPAPVEVDEIEPPAAAVVEPKPKEIATRNVAILKEMLDQHDELIRKKQNELDRLKIELGISQLEEATQAGSPDGAATLQKLELARVEAQAEYEKLNALYANLTNLSHTELRRAVATASPDHQLANLQDQLASAEQKLTTLQTSFSAEHPEVRSVNNMRRHIELQIEQRLDGILAGLKARTISMRAGVDRLRKEVEVTKSTDIDASIRRRSYFQGKRELESLQKMRDRLAERLMEETINAALAK